MAETYKYMGYQAEDKITNFCGIISGRAEYITGCDQLLLSPKADKNKLNEGVWIDEQRITITSKKPVVDIENDKPGSMETPPIK